MPRGQKRTEIEIIQAQIAEADKKRRKNLDAADAEKKKITALEKKIDKTYADNIAKACRTKGISLERVLQWVLEQPDDEPAPADIAKSPANKPASRKPAAKTTTRKKPAAKKAAPKKPAAKAEVEKPAEESVAE